MVNEWKVGNLPFNPHPDPDRGKYWPEIPDDWVAVIQHEANRTRDGLLIDNVRFFPFMPEDVLDIPLFQTRGLFIVRDTKDRIPRSERKHTETFQGHRVVGKFDFYPRFHFRELPEGSHRAHWKMAEHKALFFAVGYKQDRGV